MNDTNNTTAINSNEVNGTTTTAVPSSCTTYGNYCWNRLPCGICTRTNQICPLGGNLNPYPYSSNPYPYSPIITWTSGEHVSVSGTFTVGKTEGVTDDGK